MSGYRVCIAEGVDVPIEKLIARPSIPLTNENFVYTPAAQTDIRKRFERMAVEHANPKTVRPIGRKQGGK